MLAREPALASLQLVMIATWEIAAATPLTSMSDRERASVERYRNKRYRYRDKYGGGGGIDGGF